MILNGVNLSGWNGFTDKLTKKTTSAVNFFGDRMYENITDLQEKTADKGLVMSDSEDQGNTQEESRTATQVLVKPDGSRVLLVKVMVAGMQTTMGLRLSEETDMPNSSNETAEGFSEDNTDMAELPLSLIHI